MVNIIQSNSLSQKSNTFLENCPRLCHLHLTKAESSYGFNLYKRKGDDGQYIGYIDDGSPADLVGLKNGDRLVEVNGENVENKSHKKAVNMIRYWEPVSVN